MGLVRLRQCLWRNGYAAVFASLALPALITTARAQDADFLDGITLELPPFPPLRNSLLDSASPLILVAAAAESAPGAVEGAAGPEAAEPVAMPAPGPAP